MGIVFPGTFPGKMAATRDDYERRFTQIKETKFNCICLYTLHFSRFYEALYDYNQAHPRNPLLFIQGVWLEEELEGYEQDLSAPNVVIIKIGTGAGLDPALYPETFVLSQNYPNPFNTSTTLEYTLGEQAFIEITIYNTPGNEITTLVREKKTAGTYSMQFQDASLSSGIYYCVLMADRQVMGKNKMVLIK
jgi:hypothetical protein